MYISSEFQLGQVYMGDTDETENENVIIYRPVYICVPHEKIKVTNTEKDGMVSRAGSRISMTRLFDRKSWKMQSSRDSDREDSSVTDLNKDMLTPEMTELDIKDSREHIPLRSEGSLTDRSAEEEVTKDFHLSADYTLKPSDSLDSIKLSESFHKEKPEYECTPAVIVVECEDPIDDGTEDEENKMCTGNN